MYFGYFISGLILGAFIGGIIGVVVMCLCFVSSENSREEENIYKYEEIDTERKDKNE